MRVARCLTSVALVGWIAVPVAIWREQLTAPAFALIEPDARRSDLLHLTLSSGRRGASDWEAPEELLAVLPSACERTGPSRFAIGSGRFTTPVGRSTLGHLGAAVLGDAVLLDALALPQRVGSRCVTRSRMVTPSGSITLESSGRAGERLVSGTVAAALPAWSSAVLVIAPRAEQVAAAHRVVHWLEELRVELCDDSRPGASSSALPSFTPPSLVVVADWHDDSADHPLRNRLLSNVLVGPFGERGGVALAQLAGVLAMSHFEAIGVAASDPRAWVAAAAFGDLVSEALSGEAGEFTGVRATQVMAHRLARTADFGAIARAEPIDTETEQRRVMQLLGPRARVLLRRECELGDDRTDRPLPRSAVRRLGDWLGAVTDGDALARLYDAEASRGAALAAVRAQSIVEPPVPSIVASPITRSGEVEATAPADHAVSTLDDLVFELANQHVGYLESCGCKGTQGGGFIDLVRAWGGPVAPATVRLLLGNSVSIPNRAGFNREANDLILATAVDLEVAAFVPGAFELAGLASGDLAATRFARLPVTACNVTPRRAGLPSFAPWIDLECAGGRVRLVGVVELTPRQATRQLVELIADGYAIADPVPAVVRAGADLAAEARLVVTGNVSPTVVRQLAVLLDRPWIALSSDYLTPRIVGEEIVRNQDDGAVSGVPICFAPGGAYHVKRTHWNVASRAARSETIALADAAGDEVAALRFRHVVQELLERDQAPVELHFDEPLHARGGGYVGNSACSSCHVAEHADWQLTPHATAFRTLERVQRQRVRNCVACHVVGFGQESGYDFEHPDRELQGVGCEVCHGPGRAHVASGGDPALIRRTPEPSLCASCHSNDHSIFLGVDPETFFRRVRHASSGERP